MEKWPSVIMQIVALFTEYLVCRFYERKIIAINDRIEKKNISVPKKRFLKYGMFMITFILIYVPLYFIRLWFFHSVIHWGIRENQFEMAMINTIPVALTIGPMLGFVVIWRRKKRKRKEAKERSNIKIRIGSSV